MWSQSGFRTIQNAPIALLHGWYSLIREKRPAKLEFLRAMSKVFDIQEMTTQQDIYFARYMADNIACFEYKLQEDVLTVAKHLTSVLSTSGTQLVETVAPAHLLTQLHSDGGVASERVVVSDGMLPPMQSSIIICVVMLLKTYLKSTYGISEE
jgi:cohesin loading factor subunit SCC2